MKHWRLKFFQIWLFLAVFVAVIVTVSLLSQRSMPMRVSQARDAPNQAAKYNIILDSKSHMNQAFSLNSINITNVIQTGNLMNVNESQISVLSRKARKDWISNDKNYNFSKYSKFDAKHDLFVLITVLPRNRKRLLNSYNICKYMAENGVTCELFVGLDGQNIDTLQLCDKFATELYWLTERYCDEMRQISIFKAVNIITKVLALNYALETMFDTENVKNANNINNNNKNQLSVYILSLAYTLHAMVVIVFFF